MTQKINNEYIECEDYYILKIFSEKYGEFNIKIDSEDLDKCSEYHWSIHKASSGKDKTYIVYYAVNQKVGLLHRFIMNAPKGMVVDHIDGNNFDNRKQNLRICTNDENIKNRKIHKRNKSGVTGVCYSKNLKTPKWMAYICLNGKRKHIGYYDTKEEAIEVRQEYEKRYYGEFSRNLKINN